MHVSMEVTLKEHLRLFRNTSGVREETLDMEGKATKRLFLAFERLPSFLPKKKNICKVSACFFKLLDVPTCSQAFSTYWTHP